MTSTAILPDPYALTTHAIVRLDPSPGRQAAAPSIPSAKGEPPVAATSDETRLSLESVVIAHALTLSDVRVDKVAHLQQAIAAGTYHVSSTDVAGKLLDNLSA